MTVGSTSRSTKGRGVNSAPSRPRSLVAKAFSSSVPKMAGSTSAQSLPAAKISKANSFASTGSGATSLSGPARNKPPLKRSTRAPKLPQ